MLNMAAELFVKQMGSAGGGLNLQTVMAALQKLLPSNGGELDLARLIGLFSSQGGGLAAMASSWLGDGANQGINASQIISVLGEGKVAEFAAQLGLQKDTAANGLAQALPDLIDKNSKGGEILGSLAGSVLGKLF
jgi:uncharacterized protein YidB (DUF937 family)